MKELALLQEKLKTVDPRVLYAALGITVLLFVAADFFFVLNPQIGGLVSQGQKNAELKGEAEKLQIDKQHVDQFRKGLTDMKAKAVDFERMVYGKDDIPVALKNISTSANEYGVKIDQLVPQLQGGEQLVKNSEGTYKSVAIAVNCRSGYHEFGRFLNKLEHDRVFWKLDEFSIAADNVNPQKHLIRMLVRILVLEK